MVVAVTPNVDENCIMMMESCMATVTTGPSSPIPLLVAPPPPSLSSVSTFHPLPIQQQQPPSLISPTMSNGCGGGNGTIQTHNPTSSFSSSCGSSSSTTGSVSGGISGGGCGSGGGGGLNGDNSSGRCSSSSISGSNPRLNNASLLGNKMPIQTIPPPLGSSTSVGMYQIHDGFATVRKRKGPSAASIAMRQQEEIYDLAQPIPVFPVVPPASFKNGTNGLSNGRGISGGSAAGGIKSRHSSFLVGRNSGTVGNIKNGFMESRSASLLSTHPSLNLGKPVSNTSTFAVNGAVTNNRMMMTSPVLSPSSLPVRGGNGTDWETVASGTCPNPNCPGRPWPLSCDCRCSCCCTCTRRLTTSPPPQSNIPSSSQSSSSGSSNASSIHKARVTPLKSQGSGSTTSLGRKLRRFVLPSGSAKNGNQSDKPSSPSSSSTTPTPPPSVHQFHSSFECVSPMLEPTLVPIRKSPSAQAALGNGCSSGQYYPSNSLTTSFPSPSPSGDSLYGQTGRLRNSISDNSIAAGLSQRVSVIVPNDSESGVSVVTTPPTPPGQGQGGVHSARHFHRSCFLPKAPPLEPVMEDGIPWRKTRKDVPWWELAIRRGRYRSCPILQATPQAHVVAAFEQSLSNMTQRLQTLTMTAEQKDSELNELRTTIELLRKQSVEAGLTVAQMTAGHDESPMARQLSADSVSSINSISSACSGTSHSHTSSPSGQVHMTPSGTPTHSANLITPESPGSKKKHPKGKGWLRSSFTKAFSRSKSKTRNEYSPDNPDATIIVDQDGSVRQLNGDATPILGGHGSTSHGNHHNSHQMLHRAQHHHLPHHQNGHGQNGGFKMLGSSMPTSPLLSPPTGDGRKNNSSCSVSTGSHSPRSNGGQTISNDGRSRQGSSSGLSEEPSEEPKSVDELRKQLREKEMVLTDIRLEALTSAHQLESMKETVTKMRNEMMSLKQDNERLQRMVTCKSLTSSQTSLQMTSGDGIDRRLSASEVPPPSSTTLEMFLTGDATEKEGKRIVVSVYLGSHGSYERYISPIEGLPAQECIIGTIQVSNKTKWDSLDSLVKRAFKDYLMRIDPMSSLGLSADSVFSYAIGDILRNKEGIPPELLPCGYLVGDVNKIRICLKGALHAALDALAFETLVPKSVLQRYMSLLADNGRIIICGPSGTGKSYLARKIGEYLVARSGKDPCPEAIASFSADHKNGKELRQYLTNLLDQCDGGTGGIDLPSVIILDNLHQVQNLGDVFNGVLLKQQITQQNNQGGEGGVINSGAPIIIGTMTQSASSPPAAVQLHHNFRWILFGSHTEPVKGLLSRYLQRRLIEVDTQNGSKNLELARIVDWIPKVWHHVNKFLEAHNSADVTIGPRLFLSCPMDVANSQVWFTDLWHYSVVPYLIEATKEGLQMYGKKSMWEDPSQYLILTYPWSQQLALNTGKSSLQRIRPEDVGYDTKSSGAMGVGSDGTSGMNGGDANGESDPLMNMLMRLQEAANYSGPQSNDSDTTSLDSHMSLDHKDYIKS